MLPDLPTPEASLKGTGNWPHAPPHRLAESGVYLVTARARDGAHLLEEDRMKDWFLRKLHELADEFGWTLEAWAILSNHYHLIAHIPSSSKDSAESMRKLIQKLHSLTTREINARDGTHRTRLWQNYRETHLTLQRGYLARLHYVHQNAVHHGLVAQGSDWEWCSARAFMKEVSTAWSRTITSFKYDEIAKKDGE